LFSTALACVLLFSGRSILNSRRMIDKQTLEALLPRAYEWAKAQEEFVLARGASLALRDVADAIRAGVHDPARIRVLVVDRIPLPEDPELAAASRRAQIITDASRGVAIGHAVIIRADAWGDRELLLHQLVHVAQSERCGGLKAWVEKYLSDRQASAEFTVGVFEAEARGLAREICAGDAKAVA
jgi:hypothetical protein